MKRALLIKRSLFAFLIILGFGAQAMKSEDWGVKFSGFLKTDIMYDSRQTEALREGHLLLIPLPKKLNADDEDLNGKSNFNMLSVQSRVAGAISAPDVLGAKTSGHLEIEFFGTSEASVNGLRLRHAYAKLDWDNTSLLIGQTWHPFFITDCFPGTVSFNTGIPFQPFSRNPQVRLTQRFGGFAMTAAAMSQRDFSNPGPDAAGAISYSSKFLRNSVVPDLFFGMDYRADNFLIGAGANYKMITPRTATITGKLSEETVNSFAGIAYMKANLDPVTIKLEGVYGQDLSNLMMHGGYAIKSIDAASGQEEYTKMNSMAVWTDISIGKEIEYGIFAGFSKYLGFEDNILAGTNYYARYFYDINNEIQTLDYVYRVSPRIQWNIGKFRLAGEIEWTSAKFGEVRNDDKGKVNGGEEANNLRLLIGCFIFF